MYTWSIGVIPYVLADGAHAHFSRGEQRRFAIEYYSPNGLQPSSSARAATKHVADSTYWVTAPVVYRDEGVTVLDCGILVYHDWHSEEWIEPPGVRTGEMVTGELRFFVDDYLYKEFLHRRKGMPPLMYTWSIDAITMRWEPYIEQVTESGDTVGVGDDSRASRRAIHTTRDAVPAEMQYERAGRILKPSHCLTYFLECTLLPLAPKHTAPE